MAGSLAEVRLLSPTLYSVGIRDVGGLLLADNAEDLAGNRRAARNKRTIAPPLGRAVADAERPLGQFLVRFADRDVEPAL